MKILILGDVVGNVGRIEIQKKLKKIIKENQIDFTVLNGENSAEDGRGITKSIAEEFFKNDVDVITSGNHIWDKSEITEYISKEKRLLRPENLTQGSPGNGCGIFLSKSKNYKVAVINLMGNVFMRKTEDLFTAAKNLQRRIKLKQEADFIIIDVHAETTSEKMAIGHFFDGKATVVVGTHTHIPSADTRILDNGTAYQTDLGMCGDYKSVIGMNRDNSLKKFLKDSSAVRHYPAKGNATISGLFVTASEETGLALKIQPIILGGSLEERI